MTDTYLKIGFILGIAIGWIIINRIRVIVRK